ncbi:unnamed protein product, partial [Urochloa humidicola]
MKTRSSARGEPRRLGNVALLALMLCSVVALSLIRGRFAPIVTRAGDAIKAEDEAEAAVSKAAVNIDAGEGADEAAAEAAAAEEKDKEAQPQPGAAAAKPVCYETSRRSDTCEAAGDVRLMGSSQTVYVDTLDRESTPWTGSTAWSSTPGPGCPRTPSGCSPSGARRRQPR